MSKVIPYLHILEKPSEERHSGIEGCDPTLSRKITINRLCGSLISSDNQARFRAFPDSYCRDFNLSLEQIQAVTDLDIARLYRLGVTVPNLRLLTGVYALDMLDLCCEQTGKSIEDVRALLGQD